MQNEMKIKAHHFQCSQSKPLSHTSQFIQCLILKIHNFDKIAQISLIWWPTRLHGFPPSPNSHLFERFLIEKYKFALFLS